MPLGSEGAVSRALPQGFTDQQVAPPRLSKYRELYVNRLVNGYSGLSDEGAYFVITNPTPLTAIAMTGSVQSYSGSDTNPLMIVRNNDAAGGKRVYLDYLRLILVALPTTATNLSFAWTLDNLTNKYTSGGTAFGMGGTVSINSPNLDSSAGSIAQVYFGALTAAAKSNNARLVSCGAWKPRVTGTPCAVAGDEIVMKFGSVEQGSPCAELQLAAGTPLNVVRNCIGLPPIVIGPGQLAQLGLFGTANAGTPSFEFEFGWHER